MFTFCNNLSEIAAFLVSGVCIPTQYLYFTLPGQKKKRRHPKKGAHTVTFHWTAFSFDYGTHLLWHSISFCNVTRFISVQGCIHSSPRSCVDDGRVGPLRKAFSSTSQRFSMGLISGLCGVTVHEWKWCLMLPEPFFHLMNPGIVILEYARAIREEKNPLME